MSAAELPLRHGAAWRAATIHPFLEGVRSGELPEAAFRTWLRQDHLFVGDLLAFQARLLARAPRAAQRVLASGVVGLESELTWFEGIAARDGVELGGPRHPATEAYRAHLEDLQEQPVEVALTALWAVELAYLEAWRGAAPGAPRYREYVEHWTQPEFAGYVADLEANAIASPAAEAAWLRVVELERAFWDMALEAP